MRIRTDFLSMITILAMGTLGCQHDTTGDPLEEDLLELAKDTDGATWYKETDSLLPRSSGSGHGQALLRTRFNSLASTALDDSGKVVPDTLFPNGSVIVKELFSDANTLDQYAVMFKKPSHPYADEDGWVWGYMRPDGEVREPARNKGTACRNCHGQQGSIDFTLMNAYFP